MNPFPKPSAYLPTLVVTGILLIIPVLLWVDLRYTEVWNDQLLFPTKTSSIDRHTPLFTNGYYVPPTITTSQTWHRSQSPIIVSHQTIIPSGVTVTIEPGTVLAVSEYGGLTVEGTLIAQGTAQEPITFSTNELHPFNQLWTGITFSDRSHGTLSYVHLSSANPGITCLGSSTVSFTRGVIQTDTVGMVIASPTCTVTDSTIISKRDGVVLQHVSSDLASTRIRANGIPIHSVP